MTAGRRDIVLLIMATITKDATASESATASKNATTDSAAETLLQALGELKIEEDEQVTFVDSEEKLSLMMDALDGLQNAPPSIFIDLEGVQLSRKGTISILQLYIHPHDHTYLVDVHQLQEKAFSIEGKKGNSLRKMLECKDTVKVIFDVRNDSDALYHLFKIRLAGVQDLQLMEIAGRSGRRNYLNGLFRCVDRDCPLPYPRKQQWKESKELGAKRFRPEEGGSYEVFNDRPLAKEIVAYCVEDVKLLPQLWRLYDSRLARAWRARVAVATEERIAFSQGDVYLGEGKHKALPPPGWSLL